MHHLVYIHIGKSVPDCLFDSIYQTLLINHYSAKIFVIVDDSVATTVWDKIKSFCFDQYIKDTHFHFTNTIQIIKLSVLQAVVQNDASFIEWSNALSKFDKSLGQFRDGFWVSTTSRFFYILAFMKTFNVTNAFHIENDNMLFVPFDEIFDKTISIAEVEDAEKIYTVSDAPNRVVPSILYFPSTSALESLTSFISQTVVQSDTFVNDMDILGMYGKKKSFPIFPNDSGLIFDGAAIGQYLGGVDPNNLDAKNILTVYDNPTVGFINETCIMKPKDYKFAKRPVTMDHLQTPIEIYTCIDGKRINKVVNLHIHSKQLYQFSSVYGIKFKDIITGDRVCGLTDFVLATHEIIGFHKNIQYFAKDIICFKDPTFESVDMDQLNRYLCERQSARTNNVLKVFIYTHLLKSYVKHILPQLHNDLRIIYYTHNSDHHFDENYLDLINHSTTNCIYAQNVDVQPNSRVNMLPIGIANSMWPHGDLLTLYKVMNETYFLGKNKNIYVNINPNTFGFRRDVLTALKGKFEISGNKPYEEYLRELAQHKFCLCIRGNGVDTHRFWESLYLGVIPVIIDNEQTNMSNFVQFLEMHEVPFHSPSKDVSKWTVGMFNDILYKKIYKEKSVYNTEHLKMNTFI